MISKLKIALLQIAPCKTLEENLEKGIVCCRKAKERGANYGDSPDYFKIPFVRKIRNLPGEKFLRYFRFVILAIFVILLPLFIVDITGLGEPWFCKFICPAGTLEGGIPLVLLNKSLQNAAGFLFK